MEKIRTLHHDHPFLYWLVITLALSLVSWTALRVVSPSPPRTITMSTGAVDGAYHQFGLKYKAILKENGVELVLKTSSGAVQNLKRLNEASVEAVAVEPVWIFSRKLDLSLGLGALAGKRVAIGVPDSGTQKVARELLAIFGLLDAEGRPLRGTQLVNDGGLAAAKKLQANEVDAVIIVAAPQSPAVALLMEDSTVELASMRLAEGLTRRFPHFQQVSLKQGSVNPQQNLPKQDISLIATLANLVVREELHPALAYLLLEAAHQTHNRPGLLSRPNDFPSPMGVDFPLSAEADRYFKTGRPFLQRYLPFWLANFVQRLILVAIPLFAVLFPLIRLMPMLITWKQEKKLFRHYGQLKFIEHDLASHPLSADQVGTIKAQLDHIEQAVNATRFSLNFTDRVFTLRQHVDYVRAKLGTVQSLH